MPTFVLVPCGSKRLLEVIRIAGCSLMSILLCHLMVCDWWVWNLLLSIENLRDAWLISLLLWDVGFIFLQFLHAVGHPHAEQNTVGPPPLDDRPLLHVSCSWIGQIGLKEVCILTCCKLGVDPGAC